jgi:hypothetical protein
MPTSNRASTERIILNAYFSVGPTRPKAIERACAALGVDGEDYDVCTRLDAAVANIVLHSVQRQLPQWAAIGDGYATFGRDLRRGRKVTKVKRPKYLFTLNWGDSGPGFSWPMAYYATEVPAFGRVVVTASADSPDSFCDFAIGHFAADAELLAEAHKVFTAHWTKLREIGEHGRWTYLFDEALVTADMANEWADEVWAADSDEGWA